jgi:hypothetical protein
MKKKKNAETIYRAVNAINKKVTSSRVFQWLVRPTVSRITIMKHKVEKKTGKLFLEVRNKEFFRSDKANKTEEKKLHNNQHRKMESIEAVTSFQPAIHILRITLPFIMV